MSGSPWPREDRLRVLEAMGLDLTPAEWAERMGVAADTIRHDLTACRFSDRATVLRELLAVRKWDGEALAAWARQPLPTARNWLSGRQVAPTSVLYGLADLVGAEIETRYFVRRTA